MNETVAILGGGIAGLTAALALSSRGYGVTIVDEAAHLGGRLTSNPLVLLLGCHTATWTLLEALATAPQADTRSVPLEFLRPDGARVRYSPLPLPSPLHTLAGTTLFQGFSLRDRWHLLTFLERTWEGDPPMPDDLESRTAEQWLIEIGQSEQARSTVWNPLSRFLLGDGLDRVSAALFMRTLRRSFFTGIRAGRMQVPSTDLSRLLITPLTEQLQSRGVSLRLATRATGVQCTRDRMTAIELENGERLTANHYVSALPFAAFRRLLPERLLTHYAYFQHIGRLETSRMIAVRLHVGERSSAASVVLLPQRAFHWVITRPHSDTNDGTTVLWMVAVGESQLFAASDTDVLEAARTDAAAAYPALAAAPWLSHHISRCSNTPLAVRPGTQLYRPIQQSPLANLFVAGAWTDTGWPPNLESAIASGERCAALIHSQHADVPSNRRS